MLHARLEGNVILGRKIPVGSATWCEHALDEGDEIEAEDDEIVIAA